MADLLNGIPRVDPTAGRSWFRRVTGRFLANKSVSALHRRFAAPLDARLMRLTGGRLSSGMSLVPLVVLRTTGAKSGAVRDVPLVYFTDGDDVILIASNYGQAKYPSWYYNLVKYPECALLADGADRGGRFVARLAEGEDRDRLFGLVEGYSANFAAYADRTDGIRSIPVFRLAPMTE